jgi:Post-segregation antitoxin CcdA
MTTTKRKVSLSLDEELIAELASDDEGLSSQVNDAVRAEVERRRQQRALEELLARLDESDGPLDGDADEAEISRFMRLLGGIT